VRTNWVDHNFFRGVTGSGIYHHDCDGQFFFGNFIGQTTGPGLKLAGKVSNRKVMKQEVTGGPNTATDNIFFAANPPIFSKLKDTLTGNLTNGVQATFDIETNELDWRAPGIAPTKLKLWPIATR
jgi:hypothetical protein